MVDSVSKHAEKTHDEAMSRVHQKKSWDKFIAFGVIALLFRYTSTIGVREALTRRYVLERRNESIDTPYGEVHRKVSSGYGVCRRKYEYEDLARIAREKGISLEDAKKKIDKSLE